DALEVGPPAGKQVDDRQTHGLPLAGARELTPIATCDQLMPVANRGPETLQVSGIGEQRGDDAHGDTGAQRGCEGRRTRRSIDGMTLRNIWRHSQGDRAESVTVWPGDVT